MNRLDYSVILEPLPEDEGGGFLAVVPDLPGCMSDGESPAEALANVQDAIAAWIEAATEMGRTIPSPTRKFAHAG
jgi:predicted RNase H-like HicB family nuclease